MESNDRAENIAGEEGANGQMSNANAPRKPAGKSRRKRWPVVVGIVAVALVAAGAGFVVWHEQPSFCNAICHEPMDPYVEGFASADSTLMAAAHGQQGVACLQCHKPTLNQQIEEGLKWVSGDFKNPLPTSRLGTRDFCQNDACHSDWEAVVTATANYQGSGRNPHKAHVGDLDCYVCHSSHGTSQLYCTSCHADMPKPESWS